MATLGSLAAPRAVRVLLRGRLAVCLARATCDAGSLGGNGSRGSDGSPRTCASRDCGPADTTDSTAGAPRPAASAAPRTPARGPPSAPARRGSPPPRRAARTARPQPPTRVAQLLVQRLPQRLAQRLGRSRRSRETFGADAGPEGHRSHTLDISNRGHEPFNCRIYRRILAPIPSNTARTGAEIACKR